MRLDKLISVLPAWPAAQGMAGLFFGAMSDTLIIVLIDSQNA